MEARPFASLTAGLLARKGAARPAMRRPNHGSTPVPTLPLSVQDDLGWNDMGEDRDDFGPVSVPPLAIMGNDQTLHAAPAYPAVAAPAVAAEQPEPQAAPVVEDRPVDAGAVVTKKARATPASALTPGKSGKARISGKDAGRKDSGPKSSVARAPKAATLAGMGAIQPRSTRAAFTLRLDPDRHLRLRLACTLSGRSAQRIVTEALDHFLAGQPDVMALADQLPAATGTRKGKPA
ncbi:MAG: hypothetical protein AB7E05_03415 [Sphingobium sp.]